MPMGRGTYGSQRGRPRKNGMMMNGKKKNGAKKMAMKKRMMRKA